MPVVAALEVVAALGAEIRHAVHRRQAKLEAHVESPSRVRQALPSANRDGSLGSADGNEASNFLEILALFGFSEQALRTCFVSSFAQV